MIEVELKLAISRAAIAKLRGHPLLALYAAEPPTQQRLKSIYFDTPELALKGLGAALRVRRVGRAWIQTLKGGGDVQAGLHSRNEWETPVAGAKPDLPKLIAAFPNDAALTTLLELAPHLEPIFRTEFMRTTWLLTPAPGERVELALDLGEVVSGQAREPISEIELELKAGAAQRLFELAEALQRRVALRPSNISKAERGYRLYTGEPPPIVKATLFRLKRGMTVEQGFKTIVSACLAQVQGNEAAILQGHDPESIHQARVGLRRLSSALALFRPAVPSSTSAGLLAENKWLAAQLGAARDWEVLMSETLIPICAANSDDAGLAALRRAAAKAMRAARSKARKAVAAQRYAKLMLAWGAWLQGERWRLTATGQGFEQLSGSLKAFADAALARQHQRLVGHGGHPAELPTEQRHQVRIDAKKLRYAVEFFASLYPKARSRKYVEALMHVQDILGSLNDAAVAEGLLQQLDAPADPQRTVAVQQVYVWLQARNQADLARLDKVWRKFATLGPLAK